MLTGCTSAKTEEAAQQETDGKEDIDWLCKKIVNLRVFDDENGVMNKSILDIDGDILVISQFTLHASTKKGNRPSYIRAAKPKYLSRYMNNSAKN